jgi:hypothetical protein
LPLRHADALISSQCEISDSPVGVVARSESFEFSAEFVRDLRRVVYGAGVENTELIICALNTFQAPAQHFSFVLNDQTRADEWWRSVHHHIRIELRASYSWSKWIVTHTQN